MKFTVERLSEKLPFDFTTGSVYKRIPQYAYGFNYAYSLSNTIFNNFNVDVFAANAQSQTLAPIQFFSEGSEFIDHRHIAGGQAKGASLGLDLTPMPAHILKLKINYV